MLRHIYSGIFYLILPFILMRFWLRSLRASAYRQRIPERLALFDAPPKTGGIWIHAVSLGEVIAVTPLVKAIQKQYPDKLIIITTTTPTGSQRVQETFSNTVFHVYSPFDYPGAVKRFLKKIQPALCIIVETELWPNTLHYAHQRQIPLLLANARLSERSARRYHHIKPLIKHTLKNLTQIATQTEIEANRYKALGMPADQITVTGNIKFDIKLPYDLSEKAESLRRLLGANRLIWVVASTHEGEEEQILKAFAEIREIYPACLLLLVPRHPERFNKIAALCKRENYEVILRTENKRCSENTAVFLGNTVGELLLFYACADVAFVGGSLVTIGGHNLLEPAALGLATITGPYMHNFVRITELLLNAKGLRQINNAKELADTVKELFGNKELRQQLGEHAKLVVEQNRGALERHLEIIDKCLPQVLS